jgi:DNA polymerase III epsilon subunit-like protein
MTTGRSAQPILYFSVDVEASGPVPGLYNLVSIGAVPVVRAGDSHRPSDERFYVELKPIGGGFEKEAMAVHGISRGHLEEHGTEASRGMRDLAAFVEERCRPGRARAVFVGHNAVFDWSYISYYFTLFKIPNPFGYKALDIKALAMGRLRIGWFDTSKENLETLLPSIPRQDLKQAHRADYDALYQAHILCALLDLP